MSEPVRIGDLIAETLADLRKRADGYTGNGAARETMKPEKGRAPECANTQSGLWPELDWSSG